MSGSQPRSFAIFLAIGVVLLGASGLFAWRHFTAEQVAREEQARARAAQLAAGPGVTVARAERGPAVRRLNLVGEAVPFQTTTVYSKVSGYLSRITVDVGDQVRVGQLIAEIQAPEMDAQIATITAGLDNKTRLAQRARDLAQAGFFSQQALDNAENDVRVARAQIAELRTLGGYRLVKAPFAGVVTNRYADIGALVTSAAGNQAAALPLVTIADPARLKVTVFVEQSDAPAVRTGLEAEVVDAAVADRRVSGKVTRVSGELDARSRTRRVEVEFDNTAQIFVPGSFVNVALLIPAISHIEVPAAALLTRDRKPMVAVVDQAGHARFVLVVVAGTDGRVLRLASGLEEGAVVVVNPPASLADGAKVDPRQPPGSAAAPGPRALSVR
jgi:membrane fusion protein (multidrug efflux system)